MAACATLNLIGMKLTALEPSPACRETDPSCGTWNQGTDPSAVLAYRIGDMQGRRLDLSQASMIAASHFMNLASTSCDKLHFLKSFME